MKNKLAYFGFALMFATTFTSCLKDKEFTDAKYGTDALKSPSAVSFPLGGVEHTNIFSLDLLKTTNTEVNDILVVNSESVDAPTSNITVKLALDPTLVPAYNAANGTNIVPLRSTLYNVPTFDVVIPAGKLRGGILINIPNTLAFSIDSSYGLGFKIVSVDNNYNIASNLKNIIVEFNVKNKYDGEYKLTFSNYHPSLNSTYSGSSTTVQLRTTAVNRCKIYWPNIPGFGNPAFLSGGLSYFGSQEPEYTFSPTNTVSVQNAFVGAVTFYTMNPTVTQTYNPTTKEINVRWGYSYVAGNFALGASREWTQKFTYIGPRP
jgi:Domain of unknown function (DUF1735)